MINSRARADNGFTMIEALVALAIGGFVVASLATITGQWIRSWKSGFPILQRSEALAASLDRVFADLAAIEFVPEVGGTSLAFTGRETSISFVRRSLRVEQPSGIETVRLAPSPTDSDVTLVRTRAAFAVGSEFAAPIDPAPVTLLRGPLVAHFAYADADRRWHKDWLIASRLPRLIRIEVLDRRTGRGVLPPIVVRIHVDAPVQCASLDSARACEAVFQPGPTQAGVAPAAINGAPP